MKPELSSRKIISPIIAIITAVFFLSASVYAQDFFVWKRISPCRDSRQDWFAVAKTFPGFGFDAMPSDGPFASFASAMAAADTRKMGADFRNYCCSDWNVLRDPQTGRFSVSKQSTPGEVFRTGLCCEDAMDQAGMAVESVNDCRNLRLSTGAVVTRLPNGSFIPFVAPTVTGGITGGGDAVWFVWRLTTPCRDSRQDWFAVAKTFPGFGFDASTFDGPLTFTAAMASADAFKMGADFRNYCCPWNVYRNNQTGAFSVAKQSFVSPGLNLDLFRGGICCEEAFALAGFAIGNDCRNLRLSTGAIVSIQSNGTFATVASPATVISPAIQATLANTKCWPGSYVAWNPQTQKAECYCNTGYVWNSAKDACIDPQDLARNTDCSGYKGSYAAWNAQNNRVECWCPQGTKWNDSKTACISDAEWVVANTKCWPGSYAAWNAQAQRVDCYCNTGLVWNSTRNACIDPQELVKNSNCSGYPGSYAAWNTQNNRVECWCPPGKTWNATKTACVDNASQVNCWPGSYAAFNPQTNRTECFCNQGLVWNSTKTACIGATGNTNTGGSGVWTLVSVTTVPATPAQGWSFNAQGGTAQVNFYTGDKADFQWTPPPQQFNSNGFTVSLNVQSKPAPNSTLAALIGVAGGYGLLSDNPNEQSAYAKAPEGSPSAQRSVNFKPASSASEIEVKVVLMWGSVTCYYKYKRM